MRSWLSTAVALQLQTDLVFCSSVFGRLFCICAWLLSVSFHLAVLSLELCFLRSLRLPILPMQLSEEVVSPAALLSCFLCVKEQTSSSQSTHTRSGRVLSGACESNSVSPVETYKGATLSLTTTTLTMMYVQYTCTDSAESGVFWKRFHLHFYRIIDTR